MHDVLSGKAVTGSMHFANQKPIMWYSKKQNTIETATYGVEFCSGRTCVEQVIDLLEPEIRQAQLFDEQILALARWIG